MAATDVHQSYSGRPLAGRYTNCRPIAPLNIEQIRGAVMKGKVLAMLFGLIVAVVGHVTIASNASAGSFLLGCAARDLQVLMLIEQEESAGADSAERLSKVLLTLLDARLVCYEGHILDALAMYDDIARSIARNEALAGPPRKEIH
jgi:hypothetical protein